MKIAQVSIYRSKNLSSSRTSMVLSGRLNLLHRPSGKPPIELARMCLPGLVSLRDQIFIGRSKECILSVRIISRELLSSFLFFSVLNGLYESCCLIKISPSFHLFWFVPYLGNRRANLFNLLFLTYAHASDPYVHAGEWVHLHIDCVHCTNSRGRIPVEGYAHTTVDLTMYSFRVPIQAYRNGLFEARCVRAR